MRFGAALVVGVLSLAVVASLSGCLSVLHAGQSLVDPEDMANPRPASTPSGQRGATTDPHAEIRASAADITVPVGFHAGDGTVSTRDGAVVGTILITATVHGGFRIALTNYRAIKAREVHVFASPLPVDPTQTCFLDGPEQRDLGTIHTTRVSRTPSSILLSADASAFVRGDPTFFKGLVFVDPNAASISCALPVATTSSLVWRLPDMNPGFEVVDGGIRPGADGFVVDDPRHPDTYTAATGDNVATIAARFQVTVEDLRWLNPLSELTDIAQYDAINLDPDNR